MRIIIVISLGSMLLVSQCSNPTKEPVQWMSNFELPVTNDTFNLAKQFPNFFKNVILFPTKDSIDSGSLLIDTAKDTVEFDAPSVNTTDYTINQDSLKSKTFTSILGAIPISNAPDINETIPYKAPLLVGTSLSTPGGIKLPLKMVYHLLLSASSGPLTVKLTNTANNENLTNVSLTIGSLGTQVAAAIGAFGSPTCSTTVQFPVAGKSIDSTVTVNLTATLSSGAPAVGSGLALSFSINGLKADSLIVDDSLVAFNFTFSNDYKISDTVNIDYIDLRYGYFYYAIVNNSQVSLQVKAQHRNIWAEPFCVSKHWNKLSDIANASPSSLDSLAMLKSGGYETVGAHSKGTIAQINVSGGRMFTQWETDSLRSVSWVDYSVANKPQKAGTKDTISANDSLTFKITPQFIQFEKLVGNLSRNLM